MSVFFITNTHSVKLNLLALKWIVGISLIIICEKVNIKEVVMSILADYHMHSYHSADSNAKMTDMIESAISKGLKKIAFTEHMDHGFPESEKYKASDWEVNVDSYLYELLCLREKYRDKIDIIFGLEIGMQKSVFKENAITAKEHEFDFVIGSIHMVNGIDTYLPEFFEGKTPKQAMQEYFKTQLENIRQFQNFDVLGHMDYIVRTVPGGESVYNWKDYGDYIEETLKTLIENEKGIELNTSALRKGFSNPNPHKEIIKLYKDLGGEIITIGSDAHKPEDVGSNFDIAEQILKDCGYKYYTYFENRVAMYSKLN